MQTKVVFGAVLAFLVIAQEASTSHVEEICGKREGDRRPETAEERKKESKAEENKDDKESGKFFHQGDIRLTDKQKEALDKARTSGLKRDVIHYASAKWPDQTVYYKLDASLSATAKQAILDAIRDFEDYTCLVFVENSAVKHYITFKKDTGCWSYVGRLPEYYVDQGWEQTLSIGDGCEYKGTAIHEIMHAIGFFHEHSRNDRDQFVKVNFENMDSSMQSQFSKDANQISLGVAYDYNSVMHYPDWAFSNNGKPTLEAIGDAAGAEIGQRDGFTAGDIEQVRKYYDCDAATPQKRFFAKILKRTTTDRKTKDKAGGKCDAKFKKEQEKKEEKQKKKEEKKKDKDEKKDSSKDE
ncbi:zinc metalloproteinase nas-13-like [Rhopilema esculentum]|uniref:zinc metalloproteinase nas-13-like n=1 Tax=Rhopilema esculentum TaxID=499914 RepID=UPI0031CEF097